MKYDDSKLHIHRIVSGTIPCIVGRRLFRIANPTYNIILEADRLEQEFIVDAQYYGAITRSDIYDMMLAKGMWSLDKEQRLQALPKLIEMSKERMWAFYKGFASNRMEQIRKQLRQQESEHNRLSHERYAFDMYTAEGIAAFIRIQHLVISMVDDDIVNHGVFAERLTKAYISSILSDKYIRSLSQNNYWKTMWAAGKSVSLFNCPASEMNTEQLSLINWTILYDSVYESMECPSSNVIVDDDLLDGWILEQNKKRENDKGQNKDMGGNKPGLHETFIPAETTEDAQRIHNMNDPNAEHIRRQRLSLTQKEGKINEQQMPDSQITMRQQALKEYREKTRRK